VLWNFTDPPSRPPADGDPGPAVPARARSIGHVPAKHSADGRPRKLVDVFDMTDTPYEHLGLLCDPAELIGALNLSELRAWAAAEAAGALHKIDSRVVRRRPADQPGKWRTSFVRERERYLVQLDGLLAQLRYNNQPRAWGAFFSMGADARAAFCQALAQVETFCEAAGALSRRAAAEALDRLPTGRRWGETAPRQMFQTRQITREQQDGAEDEVRPWPMRADLWGRSARSFSGRAKRVCPWCVLNGEGVAVGAKPPANGSSPPPPLAPLAALLPPR
jgi:hypothetical protein